VCVGWVGKGGGVFASMNSKPARGNEHSRKSFSWRRDASDSKQAGEEVAVCMKVGGGV